MKTLILGIFTFFTFKTNAQNTNNINALKFKNSAEYEQIIKTEFFEGIKNIEGYKNYTPLKTTFTKNEEPPKELDDETKDDDYDVKDDAISNENLNDYKNIEILGALLNVEKTVIIGNWIVKLDLENEKAYVLNTKFSNQYNDLLSNNINNKNILSFSTDDEGLDILEELDNGAKYQEVLGKKCMGRKAERRKNQGYAYNGNRKRLDMKVVYQKAFIHFALVGKAHVQKRLFRIWWNHIKGSVRMKYCDLRYTKRCNGQGSFSFQGDPNGQPGFGALVTDQPTCHFSVYFGRGLQNYTYKIDFISVDHGNGHVEIEDY